MTQFLLFKRKVNPNMPGKDDWLPIQIAVQSGLHEIVRLLLLDERLLLKQEQMSSRGTVLHQAASNGHFKITNMLIVRAPFLLNTEDKQGRKPLDVATDPKVRSLLEKYHSAQRGDTLIHSYLQNVMGDLLDQVAETDEELDPKLDEGSTIHQSSTGRDQSQNSL